MGQQPGEEVRWIKPQDGTGRKARLRSINTTQAVAGHQSE